MIDTERTRVAFQRHIIERPRLMRLLEGAKERVILLTAPAGYGKTTLARQWSVRRPSVVWCPCTSASGDPAALALTIAREIEGFAPDDARRIRTFLRAPQAEINVPALTDRIVAGIRGWPEGTWLFVDDYHLVPDSSGGAGLVQAITEASPLPVMIASRVRPKWSLKRLLYGDVLELDAGVLSMNEEEVSQVLTHRKRQEVSWFTSSAGGWPAIVGLASLSTAEPPGTWMGGGGKLHDYFADEVFALLSPSAKDALLRLAVAPLVTTAALEELIGELDRSILSECTTQGFLTPIGATSYVVHPLLLNFLRAHDEYRSDASNVERLFARLISDAAWDEAFQLLKLHMRSDLLPRFLREAADDVLRTGRTSSLRDWVTYAREVGLVDPALDFVDSHIAQRAGDHLRALSVASRSVERLSEDDPLRHAALTQAGFACYFLDRPTDARAYFQEARHAGKIAASEALWGELNCALYEGNPAAHDLLSQYQALQYAGPSYALRLATARMRLAEVFGGISGALGGGEIAHDYLRACEDPMVGSSFLTMLAMTRVMNAQYERASAVIDEAFELCRDARLDFAQEHLLLVRAAADYGLRRYARVASIADRLETSADDRDSWIELNVIALRTRLAAEGFLNYGIDQFESDALTQSTMRAEYEASLALLCLVRGQVARARDLIETLRGRWQTTDARALSTWVRALVAVETGESDAHEFVRLAMSESIESGHYDSVVRAYRAYPDVLKFLAAEPEWRPELAKVMRRAHDRRLAHAHGFGIDLPSRKHKLSPREREVLALVMAGLTNPEIGKTLFISPVTVKAHLRHAYEKLGVRNRTGAALRAAADGELGDF